MNAEIYENETKELLFFLYDYLGNFETTIIDVVDIYAQRQIGISDLETLQYLLERLSLDKDIILKYSDETQLCYGLTTKGKNMVVDLRYKEQQAKREAEEAERKRREEEERLQKEAEEAERKRKEEEERARQKAEEEQRLRQEEEARQEEQRRKAMEVEQEIEAENRKLHGHVSRSVRKQVQQRVDELKHDENYVAYYREKNEDALVEREDQAVVNDTADKAVSHTNVPNKKDLMRYTFFGAFAGAGLGIMLMSVIYLLLYIILK